MIWVFTDWHNIMAAARALLAGRNPYQAGVGQDRFYNPIWALVFVLPFTMIEDGHVMDTVVTAVMIGLIIIIARRMSSGLLAAAIAAAGAGTMGTIVYGNIDPFVWLGLFFPLPIAILLLAIKPQATALVIVVLLLRKMRASGIIPTLAALAPTAIATALWLALYGMPNWDMTTNTGNMSLWPYGLLVGLPVAVAAVWRQSVRLAALAMVLCSPYLSINSYLGVSLAYPAIGFVLGWGRVLLTR